MNDCTQFKSQISRIKGQVAGVEKMIESGRSVNEIVQQVSAVRAALSRLAVDLLKEESNTCFDQGNIQNQQKKFEELVTSFFKLT